jgi:hypothetical protein
MSRRRYRVLFEWAAFEQALREAAGRRGWSESQVAAALQRDRLCTIDVDDVEAHLDWHQRLGFEAPSFGPSEG